MHTAAYFYLEIMGDNPVRKRLRAAARLRPI